MHDLLADEQAEWAVFGAVAANVYRNSARTTQDLDLLVSLDAQGMARLAEAAEAAGWSRHVLHPDGSMLRLSHPRYGAVDLIAVEIEYQREAIRRAQQQPIDDDTSVKVLAVEDVIIHKAIAGRYRDDADVESILEAVPELDEAYLNRWLEFWGVRNRFEAIRAQVAERRSDAHRRG